jgi:hypothetical protein
MPGACPTALPGKVSMTMDEYHETLAKCNARRRLANRRAHELVDFEHGGFRFTAGGPLAAALDLIEGGAP